MAAMDMVLVERMMSAHVIQELMEILLGLSPIVLVELALSN
jgi:hypothetical protein